MESYKQAELTRKMGTDSGGEQDDSWGDGWGGGGFEEKGKRTHGQQCGDCWEEGIIRGLNVNGNKYNQD